MCTAVRQDLAPRCGGTDAKRLGDSQLGHLRALLRFTIPSVYASDSSTQILPQHIGKPEFPDTGWDRIKDLFYKV